MARQRVYEEPVTRTITLERELLIWCNVEAKRLGKNRQQFFNHVVTKLRKMQEEHPVAFRHLMSNEF